MEEQLAFSRVYFVYEYLVKKHNLIQYYFRMWGGFESTQNMVIIRPSTHDENLGTNCGNPLFPDLKK